MLRIELKKATNNWLFWITLGITAVIAVWSGISAVLLYFNDINMMKLSEEMSACDINPDYGLITLFNKWIGQDYISAATSLFYLLLPIFAVLPYACSYFSERKSGYMKLVITRTYRSTYFLSKYAATFISGAMVIIIPMAINFMVVSSFIPAAAPDVYYDIYYSMPVGSMGSELFYEHPYLFVLFRFVLAAIFSGLIATTVIAISFFVDNRFAVMLIPFLALITINYFSSALLDYTNGIEISPIKFIHGGNLAYPKLWVVLLYGVLLFLFSFGTTMQRGRKNDVF